MWTVIYIAQTQQSAQKLCELLENEGIMVKLNQRGNAPREDKRTIEIMVPELETEDATLVVNSFLQKGI